MRILYSLFIYIFNFIVFLVSPFNKKAELMLRGRKEAFRILRERFSLEDKVVWFHAASLGEFEQGRPLIEKFKEEYPEYKILLTFFSPSGYEVRKNYDKADAVVYLPSDTISNAKKLLNIVKPEMVFFIKYEFWYNYISQIKKYNSKLYQVSLILRPEQYFFKKWGVWFSKQLYKFDYFFVQNIQTKRLLNSLGIENCIVSGDTRFDRVAQVAKEAKKYDFIETFCDNKKVLLVGSSWDFDEKIIKEALEQLDLELKIIIAPHEVKTSHIDSIIGKFPEAIKYSEINNLVELDIKGKNILIIDCIGILSSLYSYSTIAYIGGGFGSGIHNILEAATFGKPICFGPNYHKFKEAIDLIERKGAFEINDSKNLLFFIKEHFNNESLYNNSSSECLKYIKENIGACDKIFTKLFS